MLFDVHALDVTVLCDPQDFLDTLCFFKRGMTKNLRPLGPKSLSHLSNQAWDSKTSQAL